MLPITRWTYTTAIYYLYVHTLPNRCAYIRTYAYLFTCDGSVQLPLLPRTFPVRGDRVTLIRRQPGGPTATTSGARRFVRTATARGYTYLRGIRAYRRTAAGRTRASAVP